MVSVGLEIILQERPRWLCGKRIGLITNHTGVDAQLRTNIDLLLSSGFCKISAVFSPEHGLKGSVAPGEPVDSYYDKERDLMVYSLYGPEREPRQEWLQDLDLMLFDIGDVGCRFYTYPYTMANCMRAAKAAGLPFVVLDRPNPLGGLTVEGNLLEQGFSSFVGQYSIAIRHGLTVGELALLFNSSYGINCSLRVVPMANWRRGMWWNETGRLWVMPSPNIPTPETTLLYPATCLFEGTNLSEGRGTTKPFHVVGAPFVNGEMWVKILRSLNLPGVIFRSTDFMPSHSKFCGQLCHGVEQHITNRDEFKPTLTALHMLHTALELNPHSFAFVGEPKGGYFLDSLAGTDQLRLDLLKGRQPTSIYSQWENDVAVFRTLSRAVLLYHGERISEQA